MAVVTSYQWVERFLDSFDLLSKVVINFLIWRKLYNSSTCDSKMVDGFVSGNDMCTQF